MKIFVRLFVRGLLPLALILSTSVVVAQELPEIEIAPEKIVYESAGNILNMHGNFPNPCVADPQPSLRPSAIPNQLILIVAASVTSEICLESVGANYHLAFDIRSLKYVLQNLNLDPDQAYHIVSDSADFDMVVDFSDDPLNFKFSTVAYEGILRKSVDGYFLESNAQKIRIKSPNIDLSEQVEKLVKLQGHILRQSTPAVQLVTPVASPSLLVTGLVSTED